MKVSPQNQEYDEKSGELGGKTPLQSLLSFPPAQEEEFLKAFSGGFVKINRRALVVVTVLQLASAILDVVGYYKRPLSLWLLLPVVRTTCAAISAVGAVILHALRHRVADVFWFTVARALVLFVILVNGVQISVISIQAQKVNQVDDYMPSAICLIILGVTVMSVNTLRLHAGSIVFITVQYVVTIAVFSGTYLLFAMISVYLICILGVRFSVQSELLLRKAFLGGIALQKASEEAIKEEAANNVLLENTFPRAILDQIGEDVLHPEVVQRYDDVTVMFAKVIGFDATMDAEQIATLDDVYVAFDHLLSSHSVEKIKTIGATYMVAAGAPLPSATHAKDALDFAIAIASALRDIASERGLPLRLQAGMHSGPVVGGIVGRLNFCFDIFGDTVNVASRMLSMGLPGKLQTTAATLPLLRGSTLERRGLLMVKGKGEVETYLTSLEAKEDNACLTARSFLGTRPRKKETLLEFLSGAPAHRPMMRRSSMASRLSVSTRLSAGLRRSGSTLSFASHVSRYAAGLGGGDDDDEDEVVGLATTREEVDGTRSRWTLKFRNAEVEAAFQSSLRRLSLPPSSLALAALIPLFVMAFELFSTLGFATAATAETAAAVSGALAAAMGAVAAAAAAVDLRWRRRLAAASMVAVAALPWARFAVVRGDDFAVALQPGLMVVVFGYCTSFPNFTWVLPFVLNTLNLVVFVTQPRAYYQPTTLQIVAFSLVVCTFGDRSTEAQARENWLVKYYAEKMNEEAQRRREASEVLLLNTLPAPIVDVLRSNPTVMCSTYHNVAVLFCDIVGFTELSSTKTPEAIVDLLNNIFARFDDATVAFGVEKIKTIGDCFVAVAGLLTPSEGACVRLVRFALEMVRVVREVGKGGDDDIRVRIGVHCGPVSAGCLGRRKFIFDCFGPTVDVAEALEAGGEARRVHVSEAVFREIRDVIPCNARPAPLVGLLAADYGSGPTYFVQE